MKVAFQIGHNDLRMFLREKISYVWLFLVPLLFIYFMGAAMQGPGNPSNPKPSVWLQNQDEGFMGALFVNEISSQGVRLLSGQDQTKAERRIRIPPDFTRQVTSTNAVTLEFWRKGGSDLPSAMLIEARLIRSLFVFHSLLVELSTSTNQAQKFTESTMKEALDREGLITLEARFAGRKPVPAGFNQSLPGVLVMFLLLNLLIFGGTSISEDRKSGVLKRIAVYPLRKWELVIGKVYGRFLLGVVQILFFLLVGPLVFGVDMGRQPLGIVLTLGIFAWMSASLGVLVGALAKNPDSTIALCVLVSMMMAALGGCWWPLEVVPDGLRTAGHFFPTAWAMDALHQLISFGSGLERVTKEILILLLFALVSNILAARFLRFGNN